MDDPRKPHENAPRASKADSVAITLLRDLHKLTGDCRFAFPAVHTRQRTMSENTLNTALRRVGFTHEEATSHGFRASASSLLNECGLWAPDAIEAELAHVGADEVRKAYHRALHWEERVKMAEMWVTYLTELRNRSVHYLHPAVGTTSNRDR